MPRLVLEKYRVVLPIFEFDESRQSMKTQIQRFKTLKEAIKFQPGFFTRRHGSFNETHLIYTRRRSYINFLNRYITYCKTKL